MEQPVWLGLFFLAIAIGYALGRHSRRHRHRDRLTSLSQEYMRGLNFLLNEQPDKAVDIFVNSLSVTPSTIETHLGLARLFRKRGELDRATRIHSHLLMQQDLPASLREEIELELARDYTAAGLLDRAEAILQQMLERGTSRETDVVRHLMSIFEQEKDWHNALAAGERLLPKDATVAPVLAHYCCELAQRLKGDDQVNAARRTLRRALQFDRGCVRANMMLGRLEMRQGLYEDAIRQFRRIRRQDAVFFDEVLDDLERCYVALGQQDRLDRVLARYAVQTPTTAVILKLADRLKSRYGEKAASLFIADYMKAHPSVRGLSRIVDMNIDSAEGSTREHFDILQRLTRQLLAEQSVYRCNDCGFDAQHLHWQCPTCKHWGTLRPQQEQEQH
ncbi:MAG: lipopolysaccharide assembly protein LapB [Alcanivoracaceae bacterium]|nr:lipopolysaccharide assembly protein LapB [Alcanivoracaceae bacterium]